MDQHEEAPRDSVSALPRVRFVQIQTHSRCNADCVFCPYSESWHAQNHGIMTEELFESVLQQLLPFAESLNPGKFCLYLMQEPLLDKRIYERIALTYRYFPGTLVEISTNGAALDERSLEKLLDASAGRRFELWISHHGIDAESFEFIMKMNYAKCMGRLMPFLKSVDGRIAVMIRGCGESSRSGPTFFSREQYIKYWDRLLNEHGVNRENISVDAFRYIDRAGTLHREDRGASTINFGTIRRIGPSNPFYCRRITEWVHVMYDGTLRICCMDYHGEVKLPNLRETSLVEYFRSAAYRDLVDTVTGRREAPQGFICTRCVSPHHHDPGSSEADRYRLAGVPEIDFPPDPIPAYELTVMGQKRP